MAMEPTREMKMMFGMMLKGMAMEMSRQMNDPTPDANLVTECRKCGHVVLTPIPVNKCPGCTKRKLRNSRSDAFRNRNIPGGGFLR